MNSANYAVSSPTPRAYKGPSVQKAPVTRPLVTDPPIPTWESCQTRRKSSLTVCIGAGARVTVRDTGTIARDSSTEARPNSTGPEGLAIFSNC